MKQVFSFFLALVIILSMPLHAKAATIDTPEYFRLYTSNTRLSDDGTFNFSLYSNVRSDHNFIATSSRITLEASAQVYTDDPAAESPKNDNNVFFTIYLYQVGINSPIGQLKQAANNTTGYINFNVSTGAEYYFRIEISGSLGMWEYVKGSGDFSNIYIV